jgi:hypothetical protein
MICSLHVAPTLQLASLAHHLLAALFTTPVPLARLLIVFSIHLNSLLSSRCACSSACTVGSSSLHLCYGGFDTSFLGSLFFQQTGNLRLFLFILVRSPKCGLLASTATCRFSLPGVVPSFDPPVSCLHLRVFERRQFLQCSSRSSLKSAVCVQSLPCGPFSRFGLGFMVPL